MNIEKLINSATFVIRERYKFWSNGKKKPGESVQELATRIRQGAVTCDFLSITNPLDEALRTNFVCSIQNEAVLKALFRIPEQELTFAKTVEVANDIEGAATVAKDIIRLQRQFTQFSSNLNKWLMLSEEKRLNFKENSIQTKHSNSNPAMQTLQTVACATGVIV